MATTSSLVLGIREAAHRLTGGQKDFLPLVQLIDDAQIVLLGEATHGTHEFYRFRAELTRFLIEKHSFNAVAIEADWPDAYRINRFVKGIHDGNKPLDAFDGFKRFPTWMWRNEDALAFVKWQREYNNQRPSDQKVGFYGLDLYSLHASIAAVLDYLRKVDPEAEKRARYRYACFDHFSRDPQSYAYATVFGGSESCENAVIKQLLDLQKNAHNYLEHDGQLAADEFFFAQQNAVVVKNAEKYYRSMLYGGVSTWNLRDQHMADTLNALIQYLGSNKPAKIIVWEHNSHIGDARATEMGKRGEFNVGQLVREQFKEKTVNIGFTTFSGTVTAAWNWDEPGQRRKIRPALPGSYEHLFHETAIPAFSLVTKANSHIIEELNQPRLERAIGVVYRPDTERLSHYFLADIANQFDAVIHIDETQAVRPLDLSEHWQIDEAPETYPFGV